jgi:LuxR family maltose regulon positive regulatory protein
VATPLLQTKLYIPPVRPERVPRPRLIERLNAGLQRKLTLVSAPAGFGKTTLVSEWVANLRSGAIDGACPSIAWLSLEQSDNDLTRFLTYLVGALQTVQTDIAKGVSSALESPQPPPVEGVLTVLINELAVLPDRLVLVLDDYHLIETQPIQDALAFFLRRLPPTLHTVIVTREDPPLPLARLRARGQLTELRGTDLRFVSTEAAEFLNQVMGLELSAKDIAALERRTEGWIAGLQLAAISMQGRKDATSLVKSFAGSHRYVLDYLVEEVLEQQSESVQTFLLQTAVLDRMTGSLCDALTGQDNGQATLEMLERANLFIVPLDDERRWYRYHHLFADLLRQRLHRSAALSPPLCLSSLGGHPMGDAEGGSVAELHIRASIWYEENGMELEAFHHAAAAHDVERAERLMEGDGMPLPFRGMVAPVLNWLASLPTAVLDARPLLWVTYASVILGTSQRGGVEEKIDAAEAALQDAEPDEKTRDLVGRTAALRATLAIDQDYREVIAQSRRALEYLHPDNLPFRTSTAWKLGTAYQHQGDRAAASRAYREAISTSQASGNTFFAILATIGLGQVQEAGNQLSLASETYRRVLQLAGDLPRQITCDAYLGLARIFYEWNDLDTAQQHGQQSVQLGRLVDSTDQFVSCGVFLARLKLVRGDVAGATAILAEAEQFARQHDYVYQIPEVAAGQVRTLLIQGNLAAAAHLAQVHELPISQARVHLAQGDPGKALALLEPLRQQAETKDWQDERLKVMVLQALALHAGTQRSHGKEDRAVQLLGDALALAEPEGFVRIFVDEGPPMAHLLYEALSHGIAPDYVRRLLSAFPDAKPDPAAPPSTQASESDWIEPLSEREIEVLALVAEGLTNQEIASRLFLSHHTIKAHTRNIFGKLDVHNRTEAVARGRALGILPSS